MNTPPLPATPSEWRAAAQQAATPAEALTAWREYLWLRPDDAEALLAQALCWRQLGQKGEEVQVLQRALRIDRENATIPLELARAWLDLAEWDRAEDALTRAEMLGADVEELRQRLMHERGSLPTSYARHLFNDYAPRFNEALKGLGYQAPDLIAQTVWKYLTPPVDILDLGCGTGLSGLPFKDIKGRLVGVDLAEQMLHEAAKLNLYDLLVCSDLPPVLEGGGRWDLIVAADVFVYIGNLAPVFERLPDALNAGGHVAFTVEKGNGPVPVLQDSRRYAHGAEYIEGLLGQNGLKAREIFEVVLRHDRHQPVMGQVWVIAKAN